jgi:hypothetical protein
MAFYAALYGKSSPGCRSGRPLGQVQAGDFLMKPMDPYIHLALGTFT